MIKHYIAEGIGTFALAFAVVAAVGAQNGLTPVIAALTLGLMVYTIGPISGSHINPSVTIALWSIKKISTKHAVWYIVAQFVGAALAIVVAKYFSALGGPALGWGPMNMKVFLAEALGAFFFNFGIASVAMGKAKEQMSGIVVGGSLLIGILGASSAGSDAILNPAVALTLGSLNWLYLLAPIVGAVLGMQVYRVIATE